MAIVRAQVTLDSATNRPEDAATNTYHFDTTGTGQPTLDNMLDLLEDLYAEETATLPLMGFMSEELCNGTGRIRLYNIADAEPRTPLASREISRTPSGQDGLPGEVALCVSFQGSPTSGLPQARRRGRVFIPWLTEANNELGRPTSAHQRCGGCVHRVWNGCGRISERRLGDLQPDQRFDRGYRERMDRQRMGHPAAARVQAHGAQRLAVGSTGSRAVHEAHRSPEVHPEQRLPTLEPINQRQLTVVLGLSRDGARVDQGGTAARTRHVQGGAVHTHVRLRIAPTDGCVR